MKITFTHPFPWNTTRFLLPCIAIRGFPVKGPWVIHLLFWTWRIDIAFAGKP
jgi:hypothetical protein